MRIFPFFCKSSSKHKFPMKTTILIFVLAGFSLVASGLPTQNGDSIVEGLRPANKKKAMEMRIPDANFRVYLQGLGFSFIGDCIDPGDPNTARLLAETTEIDVNGCDISDLTGIEHFPNLLKLDCSANKLIQLDVSKNTKLKMLLCDTNWWFFGELDVSKNRELEWLDCANNDLTRLDVSKNTKLRNMQCYGNQLTELDVSKNTALDTLGCDYNKLTHLDVSKNTKLRMLDCSNNNLVQLDVSTNRELTALRCRYNKLTQLDVSMLSKLIILNCSKNNSLTHLDVSGSPADCDGCALTALDLSGRAALLTN